MIDPLRALRERYAGLPPDTQHAWRWDVISGFFAGIHQGCIWTFVARVARAEMHASAHEMGLIAAAPAAGYLFATLWARQMEGRAKLPFVFWTWLLARGGFALAPLIATRQQYIALVFAMPIIFSISSPAFVAIMKDIYPDRQRGRLMSVVRICQHTTTLVAALVMGRMLDHGVGFRTAFVCGGVAGVLNAWAFGHIRVPDTRAASARAATAFAFFRDTADILRRNPGYRWYAFSVFTFGFGSVIGLTLYPIHLVDHFHVSNTQVANLQNVTSLMTAAGFLVWGSFLDRRGPQATVLACIGLVCLVPACYALTDTLGVLYVAAAITGFAASGTELGYINTTLLHAEPGRASQYQALHSTFFGVRGTVAPLCAIPLMQAFGMRSTFWLAVCVMLCGVAMQMAAIAAHRRMLASA